MRALVPSPAGSRTGFAAQGGYTLIELMISVGILTLACGTIMSGVLNLTKMTDSVSNRGEMHSGVRNATEFMQQEIGQAGRVSFPNDNANKALLTAIAGTPQAPVTASVTVSPDTAGMFQGEWIMVGTGSAEEVVRITTVDDATHVTATFEGTHVANEPILVQGAFGAGILPPSLGVAGSNASLLKIFGDTRGDGQMQYIEYWCDTAGHSLYRRAVDITAGAKPPWSVSHVLLNNIDTNPNNTACFTYQVKTVQGVDYVINVAVTLTVTTEMRDAITGAIQQETKALLNVAPRNVFNAWQMHSQGATSKIQPTPASVLALAVL